MKLVREHINEKFTEDSDPIQDMGIGSKYLIYKWFDSAGVDRSKYIIDNNLNIIVKGNLFLGGTQIKELPNNLSVRGYLDVWGTRIKELPDNLRVGGYLNIRETQIKELPKSLKVKGQILKDF
jgi:hypothetical protein